VPQVREEQLGPEDEFLLLASDGLWDVMTNNVSPAGSMLMLH
jgi:serine/threonine protein phosphatase PrpC